uniref:Serine/threonine-protein phosphatase with EF-hands n=1 Tax=Pelusios castaneus TaxID=367368 RepID=A0A8C8SJR0_9SAUR
VCLLCQTWHFFCFHTIKAAILIQRWYRCYMARLEMRRQYALSIFQSIEYAEEQAQLQLSSFFTFIPSDFNTAGSDVQLLEYEQTIEVPDSYHGPRLSFPLTVADTNSLLHAFKRQQQLHARYVLQLLHETKKVLKQMPNIIHLSTSYSKEITICGDLHGKLDDLLLIFYKNGLPSEENPYLFNGDFVDRGKNSIEILIILFAFLLVYPNHLHLNRGNHEDHIMNLRYGFTKEITKKYRSHSKKILNLLQDVYSWLPLAAIIDNKVLIVHGGISDATDLDFLNLFKRNKVREPSSSSSYGRRYKGDLLDVGEPMWLLHDGVNSSPLLEAQYLESSVRMPSVPPELTAKEWKQVCETNTELLQNKTKKPTCIYKWNLFVVDILWSDPKNQNGCTPNKFRGGGCCFGPDVTARLLKRYNLKMLIRSHECKQEGYEISHDGKVITIFSASNYYENGSNRGAYLKLNPDLVPRFVQYQVSKYTRQQTLHQRVSVVEWSALKSLREKLYSRRSELIAAFRQYDPNDTGRISTSEWASAVESVLNLALPWRTLRSRLVQLAQDGSVEYLSSFSDLEIDSREHMVQPALVETLYRFRTDLEIIFNIIDKDHSGLISIEEFRQTWKLFNSHLKIDIDDESIDNLAHSIDFNKDGSIDFNEFLEAFHVVNKFENKAEHCRISNLLDSCPCFSIPGLSGT